HTRSTRDWSSDVCSSDLRLAANEPSPGAQAALRGSEPQSHARGENRGHANATCLGHIGGKDGKAAPGQREAQVRVNQPAEPLERSEERRVGKEGRSGEEQ